LPVLLGMADEDGFPKRGTINFADNRLDSDTGTWRLRALFRNSDQALSPGMFVRLRAPVGEPYSALLVSEEALGTDQGQKFLYVITAKNMVEYRRVAVGRLHAGLRVVIDGLKPGERIVVSGLQRVRPGIEVNPKVVDMPLVSAAPSSKTAGDTLTK
jgi:RND family efflux transporter MFP subunit